MALTKIPSSMTDFTPPTITRLTSGSTYNTPTGCKRIRVKGVGGGGGGSGSSTVAGGNGGTGGNGGNTTFGTSLLVANGGNGAVTYNGATGGTGSISSPAIGIIIQGFSGNSGFYSGANVPGSNGGGSHLGPGGIGGVPNSAGSAAPANSGGGGGGGAVAGGNSGTGGGGGGCFDAIIANPSSSYSYSIGAGGTAGTAGTSGTAGGAGGSGVIIVEEYYD